VTPEQQLDKVRCAECGGFHPASELTEGLCPVGLFDLLSVEDADVGALLRELRAGGWTDVEPGDTAAQDRACPGGGGRGRATPGSRLEIPGYSVGEELARDGMGIVYRARQRAPDREVAVKMLLPFSATVPELRERFQLEVRTLAELDHPAILPIYETGDHDRLPWFSMKLATGGNLAARIGSYTGRWREIAALVATLADAAQYAHERGVLHRDLKPGNILFDAEARPFVADFGLAKFVDDERDVTRTHRAFGTPRYLAPEVAASGVRRATTASDVYSLGAILFELLAGRAPFDAEGLPQLLRRIVEEEPRFPADASGAAMPVDLRIIALKALAKNPAQRYRSARELADELRRYLAGEPIVARPAGRAEKFRRWVRREPALASAITACVLIFVLGAAGILRQLRETEAARGLAERTASDAQAQRTLAEAARSEAERSEVAMRQNLYAADMLTAQRALEQRDLGTARILLEAHRPRDGQSDLRGFEWRYLSGQARGQSHATLNDRGNVVAVQFSPDGRRLAVASWQAYLHDLPSLALHAKIDTLNLQSFAFVPGSGAMILGMRGPSDVRRWNPEDPPGLPPVLLDPEGRWPNVAVSPRGRILAVGTDAGIGGWPEGITKLYDLATGTLRQALPESGGVVHFSPDGRLLATGSGEGKVKLWNPESGALMGALADVPRAVSLRFSPDSTALVVCSQVRGVLIFDLATGESRSVAGGHTEPVWDAEISPDGRSLATASGDQSVRIWEMDTGRQKAELRGHSYTVGRVAWSPDGKILASGGQDAARLWKVDDVTEVEPPIDGVVRRNFFSPDGQTLAVGQPDGRVTLHAHPGLKIAGGPRVIGKPIRYVQGGKVLATLRQDATGPASVMRWSVPDLAPLGRLELAQSQTPLAEPVISPDGRWLFAGVGPAQIGAWNLERNERVTTFGVAIGGVGRLRALEFSPNGRHLAGSFHDWPVVLIWDFIDPRKPTRIDTARHSGQVAQIAFSADGGTLVTSDTDKFIKVWDVATGQELATFRGHRFGVTSVDISPDGRTVASASTDRTVRLWNMPTHREVARFEGRGEIAQVTFSPDGNALLLTTAWSNERPVATHVLRAPTLSEAVAGR
jgi:WD40 repeat protein